MSFDNLTVDRGSQYVQWKDAGNLTEAQKARIARGDLGEVQDIQVLEDGSYRVQTELGTLTLSGPALDAVKPDLTVGDYIATADTLNLIDPNDVVDIANILKLLHQVNVQRRQVDREVRFANRDMAMAEAFNAADKIREGAIFNLVFGCVSGAINIGMGAMSAANSFKALSTLKTPMQDVKLQQSQVKTLQAEVKMQQARVEVAKQQQVVDAKQTQFNQAEARLNSAKQELIDANDQVRLKQNEVSRLKSELSSAKPEDRPAIQQKLDKAELELDTARENRVAAQQKVADAEGAYNQAKAELDTAKTELGVKQKALTEAQNQYKAELDTFESQAQKSVDSAQKRLNALEKQKAGPEQINEAKADLARKQELLAQAKLDRANSDKLPPITSKNADQVIADGQNAIKATGTRLERAEADLKFAEARYSAAITTAQNQGALAQGLTQMGQGLTQMTGSIGQNIEQFAQAASKEHEAQAEKAKTAADDVTQDMQTAAEILRDVKDCFEALRQSQNQVFQAIMQA